MAIDHRERMFCSEFCAAALGFQDAQRYSPALLVDVVARINRLPFVQLGHSLKDTTVLPTPERTHHG